MAANCRQFHHIPNKFINRIHIKDAARAQLNALLEFAREGDITHVMKIDRLARNTIDALHIADTLANKGAGLVFHDLGDVDINSDIGRVI